MTDAEFPVTFKVARPKDDSNIGWDVIDVMWNHVNFYEDEAAYRKSLALATKGQLAVYACTWYLSEVNNGGHDQFFFNSTGMVWQDALDGFSLLRAHKHHGVLADAVTVFPGGKAPLDRATRSDQLDAADTSSFDSLDDRIYDIDEDLDALIAQYINAHPEEYFTDP